MTIGFTSCDEAETKANEGLIPNIVSVNDEGVTELNDLAIKTGYEGNEGEISNELAGWLQFMREEEKLARDVYLKFYDTYKVPVFKNISKAEQNHMNVVLSFLDEYGLEDPASAEEGVFNNEELQELYNKLIGDGSAGLVEALKVGALIEEVDIIDLAEVYEMEPGEDLVALAEALMLGSRNHLRAFTRVLGFQDVDYEPVLLSAEDYQEIIDTGWERGTGLCRNIDTRNGNQFFYAKGKGFCRWNNQ
jgi:hypothetical protein